MPRVDTLLDRLADLTGSEDHTEALLCFALTALPLGAVGLLEIIKLILT